MSLQTSFAESLRAFFPELPKQVGVAVSGGGDSMALLHLVHEWAGDNDVSVFAVTVDHGLRAEAADEAAAVGADCATLGIPHETLKWLEWDRAGNLQDEARRARIGLINEWAGRHGLDAVMTGHTLDDQAETVLMRLGRGSGVDGLSGIPTERRIDGIRWVRPLLDYEREELRGYLRQEGVDWVEDPSNDDIAYGRVRARKAMGELATLGVSPKGLAATAKRMASARAVLEKSTVLAAKDVAKVEFSDVTLKIDGLLALEPEIRRRLLSHALNWVSLAEYPPRASALQDLEAAIEERKNSTLHGCLVVIRGEHAVVTRELNAVAEKTCDINELWDGRWQLAGPESDGLRVAVLGEKGLAQCEDWRETGVPRTTLLASPAVWRGDELVAAPLAGKSNGWAAETNFDQIHFFSSLLSH